MPLNEIQFMYVLNCNSTKEIQDTLEMIYGVFSSIEQKRVNIRDEKLDEYECYFHIWCSNFRNLGSYVRIFVSNEYLRVKNWNKKFDPILKLKGGNVYNFQRNPKKEEIIEKINELIQLLKDERMISNIE